MNDSIEDARLLRIQTEAAIMKLLNIFADQTGLIVSGIETDSVKSDNGKIMGYTVRVNVGL